MKSIFLATAFLFALLCAGFSPKAAAQQPDSQSPQSAQEIPPGLPKDLHVCGLPKPGEKASLPEGVERVGNGVKPPRPLNSVEAVFSDEARRWGREHDPHFDRAVVIKFIVGTDGKTSGLCLVRGVGLGLEAQAAKAVKQYRFAPARGKDGKPVAVEVIVAVQFRLYP